MYLKILTFDAGFVGLKTLNSDAALLEFDEFRCDGRVGQQDAQDDPPYTVKSTDNKKFIFLRSEGAFDVPDRVAEELSWH